MMEPVSKLVIDSVQQMHQLKKYKVILFMDYDIEDN